MPGGLSSGDQAATIRKLEHTLRSYKTELEVVARDSRDLEESLAQQAGLVKSEFLDDARSRIASLEAEVASLQGTIDQLSSANTALDAEVSDLMRRVASGEYDTRKERVIEFKANPAAKVHAIRTQVLEDLRAENEALLAKLATSTSTAMSTSDGEARGQGDGAVPRESWERLVKEKTEMEQAHAKRLQRLKEVCPGVVLHSIPSHPIPSHGPPCSMSPALACLPARSRAR